MSPPLLEHDPVDMFLFDTRRGFCEHYASAFVVLLRAAGIPARVVTGYQGGEINPSGGYMIVRQSDAHAWAEALIDGRWQRFDPTAAVAPSRIETGPGRRAAVRRAGAVPRAARRRPGQELRSWPGTRSTTTGAATSSASTTTGSARCCATGGSTACPAGSSPAAPCCVVAAWVGIVLGWLVWRRRRADRAHTLWEAACARLARAGLPRHPTRARSPTPIAPRRAGPSSASRSASSATRTRRCATARRRRAPTTTASAPPRWRRWRARSTCCRRRRRCVSAGTAG